MFYARSLLKRVIVDFRLNGKRCCRKLICAGHEKLITAVHTEDASNGARWEINFECVVELHENSRFPAERVVLCRLSRWKRVVLGVYLLRCNLFRHPHASAAPTM